MVSKGLNPSKTRMSYNFYPKPYTGLDIYEMKEKNESNEMIGEKYEMNLTNVIPKKIEDIKIQIHATIKLQRILLVNTFL